MNDSTIPRNPGMTPGDRSDEIPVEELIRVTREFTRRITNQDRQRLAVALRDSGHSRRIQNEGPVLLQQFFAGEIDLDNDLARRFLNAPLVSHARYLPEPGETPGRAATATLSSQDDSTIMTVDAYTQGDNVVVDFSFTLFSALGLRFKLNGLARGERSEWIELMRRKDAIGFLWTRDRWDQPYVIFVVREFFGRIYAFSPAGIEAAIRLTPDMISGLTNWLEAQWFPEEVAGRAGMPARPISRPHRYRLLAQEPPAAATRVSPPRPAPPKPAAPEPPAPPPEDESWDAPPPDVDETDLPPDALEW